MKRVMCVYFPAWPMQRLLHARPELRDRCVAIAQPTGKRGAVIRLACPRATRLGVRPGMPVAEARAVVPQLSVHDEDPTSDRHALEKLAAWAERYSPIVGLEEGPAPECLLLDVTGCADCFHGEDRLAERAVGEFRAQGSTVRIAIADTLGAAWGLCHQGSGVRGQESGVRILKPLTPDSCLLTPDLRPLPVTALRLPDDVLDTLAALGFERIEQLLEMPRDGLPRVDPLVLRRLDQLLGRVPEPIVPCKFRPQVQARCSFEYATDRRVFLEHALEKLLTHIVALLREQGRGVKHLECWFFHESVPPSRIDVRLFRSTQELAHLRKLLAARLERLTLPAPACGICLRAPVVEPLSPRQYDLFEEEPREGELAALIDRLVSRLGREAVTFATLVDDPQPEYACRFEPAIGDKKTRRQGDKETRRQARRRDFQLLFPRDSLSPCLLVSLSPCLSPRPASLVRPTPLVWTRDRTFRHAGHEYIVVASWGPERIETGWWRGDDVRRDYYIVETDTSTRWWIFRRHDGQWFVQGCFD